MKKITEKTYLIGFMWLLIFLPTYGYWKGINLIETIFFVGMIVILAIMILQERKNRKEVKR